MICKVCGANMPDDAAFCQNCGSKLVNAPEEIVIGDPGAPDETENIEPGFNDPSRSNEGEPEQSQPQPQPQHQPQTGYAPPPPPPGQRPAYQGYQAYQSPPPYPPQPQKDKKDSTPLVLGIISIVLTLIPGFMLLTLVLSIIGVVVGRDSQSGTDARTGKVMCIICLCINVAALVALGLMAIFGMAILKDVILNILEMIDVDVRSLMIYSTSFLG